MIGSWVAAVPVGWRRWGDRPAEALVRLALLLVALAVPLAVSTSWYNSFVSVKCAVLGALVTLAAGGWLAGGLLEGRLRVPWSVGPGLLVLWWLWLLTGFLRSPEPVLVLRTVAFHGAQVLLVLMAAVFLRSPRSRRAVVSASLVAASLVAALALLQYTGLDVVLLPQIRVRGLFDLGSFVYLPREAEGFKIYSLLGHRNYVAGFVACLLPVVLGRACLAGEGATPWTRLAYEALGLVFVAVVLLTQTRGAWMAGGVGLALFMVLGFGPWRARFERRRAVGFVVAAAALVVALGWRQGSMSALGGLAAAAAAASVLARRPTGPVARLLLVSLTLAGLAAYGWLHEAGPRPSVDGKVKGPQTVGERLGDLFISSRGSVLERRLILAAAWRVITRDAVTFLAGVGSGSYRMAHLEEQAKILASPEGERFRGVACKALYVHSEPVHVWAETGLVGLALATLWLAWFVLRVALPLGWRPAPGGDGEVLGLMCGLAVILAHNLVSFTLRLPTVGSFAALALGLLAAAAGGAPRTLDLGAWSRVLRACAAAAVGLATVAVLATLASVRVVELAWMASRQSVGAHRFDRAIPEALQAAFGGLRDPDAVANAGGVTLAGGLFEPARRILDRARPGGTDWWLETNVGLAFERDGLPAEAERSYRAALALNPLHRPALIRLTLICLREGRFDEGSVLVETGLTQGGGDPVLLLYRGILAFRRGEMAQARRALEDCLALDPTQAKARVYLGIILSRPSPDDLQRALDAMASGAEEDFHLRVLRDHLAWRRSGGGQ